MLRVCLLKRLLTDSRTARPLPYCSFLRSVHTAHARQVVVPMGRVVMKRHEYP